MTAKLVQKVRFNSFEHRCQMLANRLSAVQKSRLKKLFWPLLNLRKKFHNFRYCQRKLHLPEIKVVDKLDFLLLDLPASYSLLRAGFGYVHEILKRQGIHHQALDLNMILYCHFHKHRIMDRPNSLRKFPGYKLSSDPWSPLMIDEWCKPEIIEYFRSDIEELLSEITRARPVMVGISLQMGNRLFAFEVVKGIRQCSPGTLIVVGGFDCVHVELGPKIFTDFDYMVIGEAEGSLPLLIERIMKGGRPKDLPGIVSRFDSPGRTWEAAPLVENLDQLSFPTYDWADLNLYRHRNNQFTADIVINRGCKWARCTFCNECFLWRKRSANNVVDEIQWFVDRDCVSFQFSVSDAIGDSVTLLEIAREIIRRNLKINISTQLRIDKHSNLEFFQTLYNAGFKKLSFGVDGWTDRLLRMQVKGYNFALVMQNLRDAHAAGIRISVNIVLGIPGETPEDLVASINNILSLKDAIDSFSSIYPLMLAPGSKYYNDPELYNIRFRGDREDIYRRFPYRIPPELWYSEEPYIDQSIRVERISFLCQHLRTHKIMIEEHVIYTLNKFIAEQEKSGQFSYENTKFIG